MRRFLLEGLLKSASPELPPRRSDMEKLFDRRCTNPDCAKCNYYVNMAAKAVKS